jgi:hypothetical protein
LGSAPQMGLRAMAIWAPLVVEGRERHRELRNKHCSSFFLVRAPVRSRLCICFFPFSILASYPLIPCFPSTPVPGC